MASCAICLDRLVVSVDCPYCKSQSHMSCIQDHLLNTVLDPHCPACSKDWNYDFLSANLPKSWRLGPYKKYRESVLFDRQKSLLPESQEAAFAIIRTRRLRVIEDAKQAEIRPLKMEIRTALQKLEIDRRKDRKDPNLTVLRRSLRELRGQLRPRLEEIRLIRLGSVDLETGQVIVVPPENPSADVVPIPPKAVRKFIQPCPAPDCRGFLSTAWKCALCSARVCPHCGDLMADPEAHECDPGNLASFTLIRRETKSCPKCGVPITKISGCDHMFCVDCNTAFSWRTLEIHPRGNTNPYYWQWREQHRGALALAEARPEAAPCGPEDRLERVMDAHARFIPHEHPLWYLHLGHLQLIVLQGLLNVCNRDIQREQRIKYLVKDITEDQWTVNIQKIEKKQRKARFVANILELFINGCIDILEPLASVSQIADMFREIEELRGVCNIELSKVPTIFGSQGQQITPYYVLH